MLNVRWLAFAGPLLLIATACGYSEDSNPSPPPVIVSLSAHVFDEPAAVECAAPEMTYYFAEDAVAADLLARQISAAEVHITGANPLAPWAMVVGSYTLPEPYLRSGPAPTTPFSIQLVDLTGP